MSSHDVQLLLLDLAIILAAARLLGAVARALRQPAVVGEIVAGIALGPTLLGHTLDAQLFPASVGHALTSLADLGLIPFMFLLGYELDRRLIRGRERIAISVSIGSIVLPAALGVALGLWLAHRHHAADPVVLALFVGAAMAVILLAATLLVLAATSSLTRGSSHTGTISLSSSDGPVARMDNTADALRVERRVTGKRRRGGIIPEADSVSAVRTGHTEEGRSRPAPGWPGSR